MVERRHLDETEKILANFGQELGKTTARLKKKGESRREMRYQIAFNELQQRGLVNILLETMPTARFEGENFFLLFDPASRNICWIGDIEVENKRQMNTVQRQIYELSHDGIDIDGVLIYHITPNGDFEIYGIPYGEGVATEERIADLRVNVIP